MITTAHATETLRIEFGNVAYVVPPTHYVGISITEPNAAGAGYSEPTDINYARVAITNNTTNWTVDANGYVQNANALEFSEFAATVADTTVGFWFISEKSSPSETGDKSIYYGALSASYPIVVGGKVVIPANGLKLCRTNPTA